MLVGEGHVTGFATIGAVVQPIGTQADVVLAFADGAIFLARTVLLGFVALRADYLRVIAWHSRLRKALYLRRVWPARVA